MGESLGWREEEAARTSSGILSPFHPVLPTPSKEAKQQRDTPQHNPNRLVPFALGWRSPSRAKGSVADAKQLSKNWQVVFYQPLICKEETIHLAHPALGLWGSLYSIKGGEKVVRTGILDGLGLGLLSWSLFVFMLFLKRWLWEIRSIWEIISITSSLGASGYFSCD